MGQNAFPGDQKIYVSSNKGWKKGDEIVLTTSNRQYDKHDKVKIASCIILILGMYAKNEISCLFHIK